MGFLPVKSSKCKILKTDPMEAIATKFVRHDVPELERLKTSKAYQLREKLNKGGKLHRAEKNWLAETVNRNAISKKQYR
jgi:hypothetical protein